MKVLFLPLYSIQWASSRYRAYRYAERLQLTGIKSRVLPPPQPRLLSRVFYLLKLFASLPRVDVVFIQKKLFPAPLLSLIRLFNRRIVFDFDDALFARPSSVEPTAFRQDAIRKRLEATLRGASHVVAGNDYLKAYALRHNPRVAVIPTPVESIAPAQTQPRHGIPGRVSLGWTGRSENLIYLRDLAPVFLEVRALAGHPVALKVICDAPFSQEEIAVINVPWRLESELEALRSIDIGLMPLYDDDWSRGKCGFKLLLFMSLGIPVVASAVGINRQIIQDGVNGYLASSDQEWAEKLLMLIEDPERRRRIGESGRKTVEQRYSYQATIPELLRVFSEVMGRASTLVAPRRGTAREEP